MIISADRVKSWLFILLGLSCFVAVFVIVTIFQGKFAPAEQPLPAENTVPDEFFEEAEPESWSVYVTGEVRFPGVYEVKPGNRVVDAVGLAGGFSPKADREAINLAARLRDEAHITVPSIPPPDNVKSEPTRDPAVFDDSQRRTSGVTYPGQDKPSERTVKIDINMAGEAEFATLPGVGPKLSAAIVAYRNQHGPFASVDEIRKVRGIGEKRFDAIRDLLTTSM